MAQAVSLAVKAAGGEAVGSLFDDSAQVANTGDDALLFFDRGILSYGGTDFGFLADVLRVPAAFQSGSPNWGRRWPANSVTTRSSWPNKALRSPS